jgi:hypothetical protein
MKSAAMNSVDRTYEELDSAVYQVLGRHRIIGDNFEDPIINAVSQAIQALDANKNLENLNALMEKLSVCEANRKSGFPSRAINHALTNFRHSLETPTQSGPSQKNKP